MEKTPQARFGEEILEVIFKYLKKNKMSVSEILGVLECVKLSLFLVQGMHIHISLDEKTFEEFLETLKEVAGIKKEELKYIG